MSGARTRKNNSSSAPHPPDESGKRTASSSVRDDLINSVKSRIKNGYYNSDMVVDDLSDSFARVLNQKI
ncbi:MAG: hypothetical protein GF350_04855 [Chitinivibrionales bacterium]|nr:hypothetical protein [Chitinivibrionales bacterium]